ncbi:hypothetical protein ACIBQX_34805 [Nonomuraea sp. NPDC049714]|uniref:hypothetical protein n=1 Tax=Nonomuraea sp. NPDC049714 TaxID=3364357 RepID=UPI0037AFF07E
MWVFVAGVLGRRLVPQLVARGHQVTTTTSTAKLGLLERMGTDGTDHLLAVAEAVGVVHFVAQSYAAWHGIRKGGWVKTEQDPLLARPLAGETAVTMMTGGRGFSNAKAKRELGWKLRYPSWREGFKEESA